MITSSKWPESFEKKMNAMFHEVVGRPDELKIVDVQYSKDGLWPVNPERRTYFHEYKCKVIFEVVRTGTKSFIFLPKEDPWAIDYEDLYEACKRLAEMLILNEPELKKHWNLIR